MRFRLVNRLLLLALALVLTGCGQKGPLYLPAEPKQSPVPSPETDNSETPEG